MSTTVKDILCNDGVAVSFDANSSDGYSVQVLLGEKLYTFACSSADAKPVLDSTKTVDLSAGGGGGGGGDTLIVHCAITEGDESTTYVLDKTWQEITDAIDGGTRVVVPVENINVGGGIVGGGIIPITKYVTSENVYGVHFAPSYDEFFYDFPEILTTNSPDGYPTRTTQK